MIENWSSIFMESKISRIRTIWSSTLSGHIDLKSTASCFQTLRSEFLPYHNLGNRIYYIQDTQKPLSLCTIVRRLHRKDLMIDP